MLPTKILQADLLDIVFDDRNKLYGAYELRKNYGRRITKSMLLAFFIVGSLLAISFVKHPANKLSPPITPVDSIRIIEVVLPEEKIEPQQAQQPQQPAARTADYATPVIVSNTENVMIENSELVDAVISDKTVDGPPATTIDVVTPTQGNGVIPVDVPVAEETIYSAPEVAAMYEGDWIKYLNRNLNAQVPTDHDAPAGNYRVVIQFVVDVDGSISSIVPLTKMGYGMEEEAVRVIKKSMKWRPASQNKKMVKAYRSQPITFQVITE